MLLDIVADQGQGSRTVETSDLWGRSLPGQIDPEHDEELSRPGMKHAWERNITRKTGANTRRIGRPSHYISRGGKCIVRDARNEPECTDEQLCDATDLSLYSDKLQASIDDYSIFHWRCKKRRRSYNGTCTYSLGLSLHLSLYGISGGRNEATSGIF